MPRLFTALELPENMNNRLSLLRGKLPGARWIDPEKYHITMRFVGDVDTDTARQFMSALSGIDSPSFELRLTGLGSFGGNKPRALWARIEPCETLMALQRAHDRAARMAGLPGEARNFMPHVTLARLNSTKPHMLAEYLSYYGGFFCEPFMVDGFVLFSSRANQGGGPYVVEAEYPFSDSTTPEFAAGVF
ncbi:MAG: RNA 2',3'-cyclic phosphodiesterase [Hyphomicrobiales bacterium]|nr:RNA 2',3'-cyclic phosphodiesterase [Hyphomicrobiales bacterium]